MKMAVSLANGLSWIGAIGIVMLIVGGLVFWVIKSALDGSEPDDVP